MKNIYFTVGPSQIYPTIPKHLAQAMNEEVMSMNHRGPKFAKLFEETTDNLRKLMDIPKTSQIFFLSSALEGMERIIQNCVLEHSFHIGTGAFSKRFYQTAVDYGKKATALVIHKGGEINSKKIIVPADAEIVCLAQNDTSTGIYLDMDLVHELKDRYPKKLIAIDIVSSVPYPKIDFKKIDIAFFSVQKGFGLPAGLGVLIVNETALKKAEIVKSKGGVVGSYHTFESLFNMAKIGQTPATPNVLNIYLLNKVNQDMLKVGIKQIRKDIDEKAKLLYQFFSERSDSSLAVDDPKYQSPTTPVFNTFGKTKQIVEKLAKQGLLISKGYGDRKEDQIRIANFPTQSIESVKKLLRVI